MQDFRKLDVWNKAHKLTIQIYKHTAMFPREELYGITSQIRRSSISVATNIAEGCGRRSQQDFARFLQISMGSASETEYLLILSKDLKLISNKDFNNLTNNTQEVKKMLTALIKYLRRKSRSYLSDSDI